MSTFYSEHNRAFQDQFETRKMADLMEQAIFKTALDDMDKQFVASREEDPMRQAERAMRTLSFCPPPSRTPFPNAMGS